MARQEIYVPDALKAEMDAARDLNINWSEHAQQAFRRALDIEGRKQVSVQESQLARLRASREDDLERHEADGVALGKEWALQAADYGELERVAELSSSVEAGVGGDEIAFGIAKALLDEEGPGVRLVQGQLEELFGKVPERVMAAMAIGFVQGASEVFDEV